MVGKQPLNGSSFSFQQTLVGEERLTKPSECLRGRLCFLLHVLLLLVQRHTFLVLKKEFKTEQVLYFSFHTMVTLSPSVSKWSNNHVTKVIQETQHILDNTRFWRCYYERSVNDTGHLREMLPVSICSRQPCSPKRIPLSATILVKILHSSLFKSV